MNQLEKTLTSLEVSEMVGREHKEVLRDIRNILAQLGESKIALSYYQESTYKSSQNKKLPMYLMTKKGCELYSTRMTGEKGIQFAVAYIERFNEMENHIKTGNQPRVLTESEQLKASMRLTLETSEEVGEIRKDVDLLKETMRIDGTQEHQLRTLGKQKVMNALGGYKSTAYKELSTKLFSRFWRDFNNHFMLPRYGELPKSKFEDAKHFIHMWRPDTSTQIEINIYNSQLWMGGVD